eukprot:TRINITY_DN54401_c0_g1_i1.p1 TRINITY_DN54401_c0_g1~~TRINITY_DN54401_c0_g1_i1.p1  ORF type:complete len:625 (-),score=122.05 TRINITY_DN54401_c0_g1_i1:127-2001(-)
MASADEEFAVAMGAWHHALGLEFGGVGPEGFTDLPRFDQARERPEHRATLYGCQPKRRKARANELLGGAAAALGLDPLRLRRPPIDLSTGRLAYWDVGCPSMYMGTECPTGKSCPFAHNREEVSYHPAKYKTKICNGHGCRGEATCCFAHTDDELRTWAPETYSYWKGNPNPAHQAAAALAVAAAGGANAGAATASVAAAVATAAVAAANAAAGVPQAVASDPANVAAQAAAVAALAAGDPDALRLEELYLQEGLQRTHYVRPLPTSITRHKQRFCASYPDVSQCRRGASCSFAHSREEARTPLLSLEQEKQDPEAMTEDFFMNKFKTLWCPIGVQHDWQICVYAHNYQDARRMVSIGYGPRPCPFWAKKDPNAEYSQRCPLGLRCPYAHGAKEQLYHPQYFRTVVCRDMRTKTCPRRTLCAFFHKRGERRKPPADHTDYDVPLRESDLPEDWVQDFLNPPFRDINGQVTGEADGLPPVGGGCGFEGAPGSDLQADSFWCGDPLQVELFDHVGLGEDAAAVDAAQECAAYLSRETCADAGSSMLAPIGTGGALAPGGPLAGASAAGVSEAAYSWTNPFGGLGGYGLLSGLSGPELLASAYGSSDNDADLAWWREMKERDPKLVV